MDLSLRLRLSVMMFLQYFVWGAWAVPLGGFLLSLPDSGGLLFSLSAVGWLYSMSSVGAMISPLFVGLIADRLFPTQRVLGVFHLLGAALLGGAALLCQAHQPAIRQTFDNLAAQQRVPLGKLRKQFDALEKEKKDLTGDDEKTKERRDEIKAEQGAVLAASPTLLRTMQLQKGYQELLGGTPKVADHPGKEYDLEELERVRTALREFQETLAELDGANTKAIAEVTAHADYKAAVNRTYYPLLALMLAYALLYMPTITLTNSLSFRNMSDPDKYFGSIRVLGTIGWIAAGLAVGFLLNGTSPQPLFLAASASALLGAFCFALPHTPPSSESKSVGDMLGLPALAMLKSPAFVIFFVCSFLLMIPLAFYYAFAYKFLVDIGTPYAAAVQSIGQVSEIVFMLLIPWCLKRFGTKGMLLIGMGAWVLRYAIFASMNVPAVVAIGLPLHGICYDFFFVVSYLYVDRKAPKQLRASAQGMITFITLGVGMFLGNIFAGEVGDYFTVGGSTKYQLFWLVPMATAAAATLLFALLFHDRTADAPQEGGTFPEDDKYREQFAPSASGDPRLTRREEGYQT